MAAKGKVWVNFQVSEKLRNKVRKAAKEKEINVSAVLRRSYARIALESTPAQPK